MKQRRDKEKDTVTLRWLWRKTQGQRFRCLLLILMDGVSAVIFVAMALVSKNLIDATTSGDAPRLMRSIGVMLGVFVFSMALSMVQSVLGQYVSGRMAISMKQEMLDLLLQRWTRSPRRGCWRISRHYTTALVSS